MVRVQMSATPTTSEEKDYPMSAPKYTVKPHTEYLHTGENKPATLRRDSWRVVRISDGHPVRVYAFYDFAVVDCALLNELAHARSFGCVSAATANAAYFRERNARFAEMEDHTPF